MILTYKTDIPGRLTLKDKENFLRLLIQQSQVQNPSLEKIEGCPFICIVYLDENPIGIGAIKQVYKAPFTKAGVERHKDYYNNELGYLYISENPAFNLRGLGIATMICKLLLRNVETNVFATTEENLSNPMWYILKKLGFKKLGETYKGGKTGKDISLFVKQHV